MKRWLSLFLIAFPCLALNSHPRIWLTSTLLTTLTAKKDAGDVDWLALKASADSLKTATVEAYSRSSCTGSDICYDYQGFGWYNAMVTLGLVYQITGDTSYASKAAEILDAANAPWKNSSSLTPIQLDDGYPTRTVLPTLAIAYDWLYSYLTSTQKTDTINTINAAYTWFSTGASPVPYCKSGNPCDGPPYMNYEGGHLLGFGMAADATEGDNGTATTIYNYIRSEFDSDLGYGLQSDPVTIFANLGAYLTTGGFNGGAVSESYNYGTSHNVRLWELLLTWKTSGRVDLTSTYVPWMKASVKNLIYILRPNLWQAGDEGAMSAQCSGVLMQNYPLFLAYMLNGATEGAWSEYLFRNLASNPCDAGYAALSLADAVLWKSSTRTATNYTSALGTNYFSGSDAHLLARSDWTTSAVFLSLNGSGAVFGEHQTSSAGNLEIQRGDDYLLVSAAQWQGANGYGGTPFIADIDARYASTLYFNDGGTTFPNNAPHLGGQGLWGVTNTIAQRADANVSYMLADVTRAYENFVPPSNHTARFFYRTLGYFGGGTVFVWDRFRASSSGYTKRLQWHLNPANAPSVAGPLISSVRGSSKLYLDVLLPASPTITTARDVATSDGTTNLTYNMQVSDSVSGTDLYSLTVAYATTSGGSFPATTLLGTIDANWVGAQVADSTPLVALFAKTVQDSGNNTYTPLNYTSTSFTSTHSGTGKYLVAGLTAGTYSVTGSCVSNCSGQVVGSDGTLYFTGTSGAYSISQGSGIVGSSFSGMTVSGMAIK